MSSNVYSLHCVCCGWASGFCGDLGGGMLRRNKMAEFVWVEVKDGKMLVVLLLFWCMA